MQNGLVHEATLHRSRSGLQPLLLTIQKKEYVMTDVPIGGVAATPLTSPPLQGIGVTAPPAAAPAPAPPPVAPAAPAVPPHLVGLTPIVHVTPPAPVLTHPDFTPIKGPANPSQGPSTGDSTENGDTLRTHSRPAIKHCHTDSSIALFQRQLEAYRLSVLFNWLESCLGRPCIAIRSMTSCLIAGFLQDCPGGNRASRGNCPNVQNGVALT
jgi:hypothetical protein